MPTEKYQAYINRGTVLTTELNSLANNANSVVGPAYDNSANRDRYAVAVLNLAAITAPADGATVELFAMPALDGTNYMDGGGAADPSGFTYLGTFILRPVATAQVVLSQRFELLPCVMKFLLRNMTGQTFLSTGTTVKIFTTNREIV